MEEKWGKGSPLLQRSQRQSGEDGYPQIPSKDALWGPQERHLSRSHVAIGSWGEHRNRERMDTEPGGVPTEIQGRLNGWSAPAAVVGGAGAGAGFSKSKPLSLPSG